MKRPTEVVGLEAKKAALKANAAKEAFLQKQEQRKKEEVEKANKVRIRLQEKTSGKGNQRKCKARKD